MEARTFDDKTLVEGLRKSPYWQEFRLHFLERMKNDYMLNAMKPANNQEQLMEGERSKGAYGAVVSILTIVDASFRNKKGPDDVDAE